MTTGAPHVQIHARRTNIVVKRDRGGEHVQRDYGGIDYRE
jgi:hypothetical protein